MKKITPRLISRKELGIGQFACDNTNSGDGKLLINVFDWYGIYSEDGGESWKRCDEMKDSGVGHFVRLADGTYISMGFNNEALHRFDPKIQKKIPFIAKIMRADSIDELRRGEYQCEFVPIDIPDLAIGYGDSGTAEDYFAGCKATGMIQLENGDLIFSMYGQFGADTTHVSYFESYHFNQYRTWCIISHDNGHSFEYLSTVADVQTYPVHPAAEGYCESDLLYLGDGHILCMMRTQGHEVYSPLYFSHSYDSGKTWSAPKTACCYGVLPRLLQMSDGTIVCTSGKYHTFMIFSTDGGYTWSTPYVIQENMCQWDRGPSGYTSPEETEPGVLTVVYDDPPDRVSEFENPYDRRHVYCAKYRIF